MDTVRDTFSTPVLVIPEAVVVIEATYSRVFGYYTRHFHLI